MKIKEMAATGIANLRFGQIVGSFVLMCTLANPLLAQAAGLDTRNLNITFATHPFDEWRQKSPVEAEFLSLYPGYEEAQVQVIRNGLRRTVTEKVVMYIGKTQFEIQRNPQQIPYSKLLSAQFLKKLSNEFQHANFDPAQALPNTAGVSESQAFKSCGGFITRHLRETNLQHLRAKNRGEWCSDKENSVCIESCLKFESRAVQTAISTFNLTERTGQDKFVDTGMASQSELRWLADEKQWNPRAPVSALTRQNTKVRGILEQNMFYWNQIAQHGKIVAIFQDHPTDGNKTIVTGYVVLAVKATSVVGNSTKAVTIRNFLDGKAFGLFATTGLMSGFPSYTTEILYNLPEVLEKL